ncbi:MAG: DoxX family protein [Candidatus Korobacteraceae bacterium]
MANGRSALVDLTFTLARVIIGLLFSCHGAQKLFGILGGTSQLGHTKMMIAGIIEFGGGLLIAFGLFTRIAAFIACGEMAVAYFTVHAPHSFWPIINKGELAVAYCFFFLFVIAHGAGPYSLDRLLRRKL